MGNENSGRRKDSDLVRYKGHTIGKWLALFAKYGYPVGQKTIYDWASGKRKPSQIYEKLIDEITSSE